MDKRNQLVATYQLPDPTTVTLCFLAWPPRREEAILEEIVRRETGREKKLFVVELKEDRGAR